MSSALPLSILAESRKANAEECGRQRRCQQATVSQRERENQLWSVSASETAILDTVPSGFAELGRPVGPPDGCKATLAQRPRAVLPGHIHLGAVGVLATWAGKSVACGAGGGSVDQGRPDLLGCVLK